MGGNALADFGARRYSKEEYEQTSKEVCYLLAKFNPVIISSYSEKDSFGDLDIIVDSLQEEDYLDINRALNTSIFIRNQEVVSVLYKELQVDIVPMSEENKDTALLYYSYNDLGNLMGKIYHKFGVKYGHRGLTLPVRDGDHKLGEILLTGDPEEIFKFGKFDYETYKKGFKNLDEIFAFVTKCPYFNPSIYALENLNSINRIRDRKRHTYHSFLLHLNEIDQSQCPGYSFFGNKSFYLPKIFYAFPHAKAKYERLLKEVEQRKAIKEKFNGVLVSKLTGLQGIDLGKFITYLKNCWNGFGPELLDQSDDFIKGRIFVAFKEWVDD